MSTDSPEAHGQAVGSWHPDADATLATALTRCAGNGDQKARRTGETTEQPSDHRAGEAGCPARTCGDCRLHFFLQAGHGCSLHPAFPAPLVMRGGKLAKLGRE